MTERFVPDFEPELRELLLNLSRYPLVVMCGLPGSGKSTIANKLASISNAVVLSSDEIRAREFGQRKYVGVDELKQLKIAQKTAYQMMFSEAEEFLRMGQNVILDATFLNPDQQKMATELLTEFGGAWAIIEVPVEALIVRMGENSSGAKALEVTLSAVETGRYGYPPEDNIPQFRLTNSWL